MIAKAAALEAGAHVVCCKAVAVFAEVARAAVVLACATSQATLPMLSDTCIRVKSGVSNGCAICQKTLLLLVSLALSVHAFARQLLQQSAHEMTRMKPSIIRPDWPSPLTGWYMC